jgi:hypothetical protein
MFIVHTWVDGESLSSRADNGRTACCVSLRERFCLVLFVCRSI